MAGAIADQQDSFLERLRAGRLPDAVSALRLEDAGLTRAGLAHLFESQIASRLLDLGARRLGAQKRGFYSIGSSGHEGNAAFARALRTDDFAFLHYRSGAFFIERARRAGGETPRYDMALSFVASSEDPCSGGRHKVIGSKRLAIPPQTSTIASHLPKAVGMAYAIALARTLRKSDAEARHDGVALCSFGDASANHSTAQGAINAAALQSYRGVPMPLIFLCEDNGIGISVPTPEGWVAANYAARPGLVFREGDGRDPIDAMATAREAARIARARRKPVFVRLRTVRLYGHAGSDLESGYRAREDIARGLDDDPLLHGARRMIEGAGVSAEDIAALYKSERARVDRVFEQACARPRLDTADAVAAPIEAGGRSRATKASPPRADAPDDARALAEPQHMSRLISLALAEEMARDRNVLVFGEDVAKKGGVYGATTKLQAKFGPARVFDTPLDEQSVLGLAIGLAQNGFLPCPEIQFLAYVHNAEDQIRGEAATLKFFSDGQFSNPMVIRIAGLAYQKGFGGHFHNDNSIAVFRDIPGLVLACPSHGREAGALLRECFRLAREEGRVCVFLEPIALYPIKDLHEEGDGAMSFRLDEAQARAPFREALVEGDGEDLAIISYGNGAYLSRRAIKRIAARGGRARLIDLRWLAPLPVSSMMKAIGARSRVLIVDECRKTGGPGEGIIAALTEEGFPGEIARVAGADTFIPLGPAADCALVSEDDIVEAALRLTGAKASRRAAE